MVEKYFRNPSHPLLDINQRGLKKWGLWQETRFDRYFYNTVHVLAFLFVISQYVELWIIKLDLELALRNLSVTMLSSVCVFKAATFVFWQKSWQKLVKFVFNLEMHQLSKNDMNTNRIISEYMTYSRKITYFYWGLTTATVFSVILAPLFGFLASPEQRERITNGTAPYPVIMSSWVPFDKTRGLGYWATIVEHSFICFYGGGVVASYDSNAVVIMSFFAGQLSVLSANCARIFGEDNEIVDYDEAIKRIKYCHYHHLRLIKFSNILNSLLSPVMFMYVIICSLMICASAVQLTMVIIILMMSFLTLIEISDCPEFRLSKWRSNLLRLSMEGTSNIQRVWVAEYLVALIAQLFLYCWHSNEVMHMSNTVSYGVYSSSWWSQKTRVRRCIVLLSGQLQKSIVFTAGPFTRLNVAAFVTILKGAYSYYTLLSKKED